LEPLEAENVVGEEEEMK